MTERTPEERLERVDERFAVTLAGYDQLLAEKADDPEWRAVLEPERDLVRRWRAEARGDGPPEAA